MAVSGLIANVRSRLLYFGLGSGVVLLAPMLLQGAVQGQIVPDETLGAERSQLSTEIIRGRPNDQVNGGAIRGSNLFHSFEEFNVEAGRGAYFATPEGIENIFSRVTGDNPSNILGGLGTIGTVDLFFINPNGILFGPESYLDLNASFVATTADGISFGEAGVFGTDNLEIPSQRLTVNPSAFLFTRIEANTGITHQSAYMAPNNPGFIEGLRVVDGSSLLLLSDEIQLQQSKLTAAGGRVELLAMDQPGSVGLTMDGDRLDLTVPENSRLGVVALSQSGIETSGIQDSVATGGEIQIQGGQVTLLDSVVSSRNYDSQTGGEISLQGTQVDLNNSSLFTSANAAGDGGAISVNADNLTIRNGNRGILTGGFLSQGRAGDIDIQVTDTLRLSDQAFIGSNFTGSPLLRDGGSSGNISVIAENLNVENSAIVTQTVLGESPGGNLTIRVADLINLDGSSIATTSVGASSSGNISIETDNLTLNAKPNDVSLIGSRVINPTEYASAVEASADTYVGSPEVLRLILSLLTNLDPNSFGQANSGEISIVARERIQLLGRSGIFTNAFGQASGGNLNVAADTIDLIGSFSSISSKAIFDSLGSGNGGDVTVSARALRVQDGAQISSSSLGSGRGGNLSVTVNEQAELTGMESGLFTSGSSTGDAGSLQFEGGQLQMSNGATISSGAAGTGNAGDLVVNADTISVNNSNITTSALNTSGGNITAIASSIRLFGDGDIRTDSAQNGGNILLIADSIIALDDGDIFASAALGQGGDITLETPAFFSNVYSSEAAQDEASQFLDNNNRTDLNATGQVGSGIITTPEDSFIENDLAELSGNLVSADQFVAISCVSHRQEDGSLVVTRADGLPETPQNAGVSYSTGTVRTEVETVTEESTPWQTGDPIVEPQATYALADGRLILSQSCSD